MSDLHKLWKILREQEPNTLEEFAQHLPPSRRRWLRAILTDFGPSLERAERYANDPAGWVEEVTKEFVTEAERRVLEALRDYERVAVPAAHDQGKSWTGGRAVAWWIDTRPMGEVLAITTAPSGRQVRAVLWKEIGRAHGRGQLRGTVNESAEWKMDVNGRREIVALGQKPADYNAEAFQGHHAPFLLGVIDEAGGVPVSIFEAMEGLATTESSRVLAIGNPLNPSSHFAKICRPGSGWKVITLDGLRSPNFTREEVAKHPKLQAYMIRNGIPPSTEEVPDAVRPFLLSVSWAARRLERDGPTSPMFLSRVRGRFPLTSDNNVIEPAWVEAAQARETVPADTDVRFGVDVARYGTNESVIAVRRGPHVRVRVRIGKGPTTELTGRILTLAAEWPAPPIANVDANGIGGAVVDQLREQGYPVVGLNSNAAATEMMSGAHGQKRTKFNNARSEWWWGLRAALAGPSGDGSDGWLDLDPDDDDLAGQLVDIRYTVNQYGQICVERKEEMAKRGVSSPDLGDAVVYSVVEAVPEYVVLPDRTQAHDLLTANW